jgi:hypothetical protein
MNWPMTMEVEDNEASIDAQGTYQVRMSGTVRDDGRLVLGGQYVSGLTSGFRLDGAIFDRTYKGSGSQTSGSWARPCEMEMYKVSG